MTMIVNAVVFDFDGVVVDSEPLHHKAFCRVFDPMGLSFSWERYYADYLGFDDRDVIRVRFKEAGRTLDDAVLRTLMAEKARAFVDIVDEEGVTPYPHVVELIRVLHRQVPVALCSGALSSDIDPILRILGLEAVFDIRVTADLVHVSKPNPESYRKVFVELQKKHGLIDPACCVAIEDTPAGIAAAKGAGLKVLAVAHTYPARDLKDATKVVDTLAEVDADFLSKMLVPLFPG
jgi:HAD superfamily hydrolase (TIGR01509 family)